MSDKIYVGDKDLVSYIGAILHNLSEQGGDNQTCHLVARGRDNNAKALDIAEMARRDNKAIRISSINLSTDEFLNQEDVRVDLDKVSEEEYSELVDECGSRVTKVDIKISRG